MSAGRVLTILASLAAVAALGYAIGSGWDQAGTIVIATLGFLLIALVSAMIARPADQFLLTFLPLAYLAKLLASGARYFVLQVIYGGSGDASGYHGAGVRLVETWRSFSIPEMKNSTEFVDAVTGFLYLPYVPTKLGGFFIFATLAFLGQVFLYLAFRVPLGRRRLKAYAVLVFLVPTIIFWPSSIGKESLMILGIGAMVWGGVHLIAGTAGWGQAVGLAFGTALCLAIRPHMATMVGVALAAAFIFGSKAVSRLTPGKRRILLLGMLIAAVGLISFSAQEFNIDLSGDVGTEFDDFFGNLEGNTDTGGSSVTGAMVTNPLDLPEATLRVLFRPLLHEAHNVTALASAVEGTVLLIITILLLPSLIRGLTLLRRDPYLVFCAAYTLMFIVAYSSFLNLGLMARERSQVTPFLMVLLLEMRRGRVEKAEPVRQPEVAAPVGV